MEIPLLSTVIINRIKISFESSYLVVDVPFAGSPDDELSVELGVPEVLRDLVFGLEPPGHVLVVVARGLNIARHLFSV